MNIENLVLIKCILQDENNRAGTSLSTLHSETSVVWAKTYSCLGNRSWMTSPLLRLCLALPSAESTALCTFFSLCSSHLTLMYQFSNSLQKRYVRTGEPIDLGVFNAIMPDFQRGVLFWIFVSLYTYSALLLQKLKLCGFPGVPLLAFLTQALPFYALSTHIALAKESTFWKCFVWTNAVIHYFKVGKPNLPR